jgi:putative ABC transport system permease protein
VVRTWPDQSHGSLSVLAPPTATELVSFELLGGRWLDPSDRDGVVLNHSVLAQAKGAQVGDRIPLSLDGVASEWTIVGIVEEVGSPAAAYVTDAAFGRVTGTEGRARMLRIVVSGDVDAVLRDVEAALDGAGVGVETAIPLAELRTAVGDHIGILIRALVGMAVVMGVVGGLGLGSAMSVSVLERTREIGVMKTIGATPRRIGSAIVGEALAIGAMSWGLAVVAAAPLTWAVDTLIGNLGFLAPLPFVMAGGPAVLWGGLVAVLSVLSTGLPAWRASRMSIRDALVQL